ncbi:MAG: tRNA (adenosine(37)-N6)-threonylcarbamoyltransferase complex dimerization subunit type 1 TsaB [Lentisphaerales bacterium]|nr:tRNA (adenosine(37)-N6)-threonylcarbamoyltransferase complex dimerization subunit type 1 TsaB [Lentisphaerales bacterium]
MIQAFLDTSTSVASFVLLKDGGKVAELSEECVRGASKLLPKITEQIQRAGIKVSEVEEWYVGKGPGSFTGLRVGISFVKGICHASGAKYQGVNSGYAYFEGLSAKLNELSEVTVLHDGRKKEVICNSFKKSSSDKWQEVGTEVVAVEDLLARNFPTCVTVMKQDELPADLEVVCLGSLSPVHFLKSDLPLSSELEEMDASCEPIYVRPPVFAKPVIRLKK